MKYLRCTTGDGESCVLAVRPLVSGDYRVAGRVGNTVCQVTIDVSSLDKLERSVTKLPSSTLVDWLHSISVQASCA